LSKNDLVTNLCILIENKNSHEKYIDNILNDLKLDVSKFYNDKEGLVSLFKELLNNLSNFIL